MQVAVQRAMRTCNETTSIQVKQREVSKRCMSEVSYKLILHLLSILREQLGLGVTKKVGHFRVQRVNPPVWSSDHTQTGGMTL